MKQSNPVWVAENHVSSSWITEQWWHPFKNKTLRVSDIFSFDSNLRKELLLINNPFLINFLNNNSICLKLECSCCNKLLIGSWYSIHHIIKHSCPSCDSPFISMLNNSLKKVA